MEGRILIADDDVSFATLTAGMLRQNHFHCDCVINGPDAAHRLKTQEYDVLISDIEMPGNRNLELIQSVPQIRAGLPVILMTGFPTVETAVRSVGLFVSAYLIKPIERELLLAEVGKAMERYRCHKSVLGMRHRLQTACADLERLEASLQVSSSQSIDQTTEAFLNITWQNISSSIQDLKQFAEKRTVKQHDAADQQWLQAPPTAMMNALWETVVVLEKTKGSFKSKELGELRRKLENLLGPKPE